MNCRKVYVLVFFAGTFAACHDTEKVNAKIFERKHLPDNQLQLKYTFEFKDNIYIDSFTIANKVYNYEFLEVNIDTNSPEKSKPLLKK